jgi:glycogen debranching enzyme
MAGAVPPLRSRTRSGRGTLTVHRRATDASRLAPARTLRTAGRSAARKKAEQTAGQVSFLSPRDAPIVKATDLGGVQVLKHEDLYMLTDGFGDIHPDSRGLGLYQGDTRILSCASLRINGARPIVLRADTGANYRGTIQLTNPDQFPDPSRKLDARLALARQSLGISRDQLLDGALLERLAIANFTPHPESLVIELRLDVDGADIFEVRGRPRPRRGERLPIAIRTDGRMTFGYRGLDGRVRWVYVVPGAAGEVVPAEHDSEGAVVVRWTREVPPGGRIDLDWQVWSELSPPLAVDAPHGKGASPGEPAQQAVGPERPAPTGPQTDGNGTSGDGRGEGIDVAPAATAPATAEEIAALFPPVPKVEPERGARAYREWTDDATVVASDNELFDLAVRRCVADLRLLSSAGPNPGERYVAAGVPWYTTLFGRDAVLTAYESLAFRPALAEEALAVLAARQATEIEDSRDMQPGKILHELRTGEMARTRELPHRPYYGSVDATPLWLILLGATFDWTGSRALVDRFWPNALAALRWIDEYGTGPDGFVTYERRTPQGLVNQGWKDSSDSIRDREGRTVEAPIALAEVQGYVFDAKRRMARLARMRGESELAARLDSEAVTLRERFEAAFWLPRERYYAMAIGRDGHVADAISSNPGQCLWSELIGPERAPDVAARLRGPDLDSGWGVRTYASGQPGYNPLGYHTGSVWPHDTGLIVAGLKKYGFHDDASRLSGSIFEAAQHFADFRLPELFCGFERSRISVPVPYPVACSPQAWAAGAPLLFLRSMLGLRAQADRRELELVQPHLPTWLGKVTISNLRVGDASVDLLFHRWRGTTSAEVLRKQGDVAVTIRM